MLKQFCKLGIFIFFFLMIKNLQSNFSLRKEKSSLEELNRPWRKNFLISVKKSDNKWLFEERFTWRNNVGIGAKRN